MPSYVSGNTVARPVKVQHKIVGFCRGVLLLVLTRIRFHVYVEHVGWQPFNGSSCAYALYPGLKCDWHN
jgi:hypothetical protein